MISKFEEMDVNIIRSTKDSLMNIMKCLNGETIYAITDRENHNIGMILVTVHVINNSHTIIRADFFMGNPIVVGDVGFVNIPTDEPWTDAIDTAIVYAITDNMKDELFAGYKIEFPAKSENEDYTLAEVFGAFERAGYGIRPLIRCDKDSHIIGMNMESMLDQIDNSTSLF